MMTSLKCWTVGFVMVGLLLPAAESLLAQTEVPGHEYRWHQLMPRASYDDVKDINAMAAAVRKSRPQMSRGGWQWDRLLSRYVDGGREEENALKILHAYFMSILDRYYEAKKAGNSDKFNLFSGHGAWGSGGRMRIYAELVRQNMLTAQEQATFKKIVNQSLKLGFDYPNIERGVNNRPYGMNGGPAIAVRMFPDMPNAAKHGRWLEVLWRELTEYGDTTETNYYPYGPLFLHGMVDLAEEMGKFESEREFLYAVGRRCLGFVHGGGVRGNPNAYASATFPEDRARQEEIYADPWNRGYYQVEQAPRDGHFWYRMARQFKDPEFLWAAEQVILGGRPPDGKVPPEYLEAYNRRFAWFNARGIKPRVPGGKSSVG